MDTNIGEPIFKYIILLISNRKIEKRVVESIGRAEKC